LERGLPANQATRFVSNTASSFISGKPRFIALKVLLARVIRDDGANNE